MARERVIQYYGDGLHDTGRALVAALEILRSSGLPVTVTPVDPRQAAAAGVWVRGEEEAVGKFERILARRFKRAGIKALPAEYVGIGK